MIDEKSPDYWQVAYERCRARDYDSVELRDGSSGQVGNVVARFQHYQPPRVQRANITVCA